MKFSDIRGNEDIKKAFVGMVDSGRIPHAILMYENDGCGALPLALAFMQYINCKNKENGDSCGVCPSCNQNSKLIYPDIHFTFPVTSGSKVSGEVGNLECSQFSEYWRDLVLKNPYFLENELPIALGYEKKSGLISKAEGAAILRKLSVSSLSDGYRGVIMYLPEKMNGQTANMLLKSIEEPSEKTIFILITHNPESVLQTISSRCIRIRVTPLSEEEVRSSLVTRLGVTDSDAVEAAKFAEGSVGKALQRIAVRTENVEISDLFQDLMQNLMQKDLLSALEVGDAISSLDSREKQKTFCTYAGAAIRKIFLLQQGLNNIAGIEPEYEVFYNDAATRCQKTFCRKAADIFSHAFGMLDRNVNQKVVFTSLVGRLFVSI